MKKIRDEYSKEDCWDRGFGSLDTVSEAVRILATLAAVIVTLLVIAALVSCAVGGECVLAV